MPQSVNKGEPVVLERPEVRRSPRRSKQLADLFAARSDAGEEAPTSSSHAFAHRRADHVRREEYAVSLYKRLHDVQAAPATGEHKRRDPVLDELRQKIHHHLIDELGSDPLRQAPLRGRPAPPGPRAAARGPRPGAGAAVGRRQGPAHPGRLRRHPRLRPDRPAAQGRGGHRGHGQRPRHRSTSSATASSRRTDATFVDETHLRRIIDKIVRRGRPSHRRVEPAVRRPPPRRLPCQRGDPPAGHRRPVPHHPEVLQGAAPDRRPDPVRHR